MVASKPASLRQAQRRVALWFAIIALMIFGMVVLGGLVRLTESGLSIVEWKVVMGTLPPLSDQSWSRAFDLYRQSPEYLQVNRGMSMRDFQFIYLMEYGHRLMGRLIGLVFVVPLLWFLRRGVLTRRQVRESVVLLVLGGAQGALGWYMVKSGLVDVPRVSHFRLAAHLGLALLVFSLSLWFCLRIIRPRGNQASKGLQRVGLLLLATLGLQICLGAFVSGLDAGRLYNTYPKMAGEWLPASATLMQPWARNLVENPTMIQFLHRHLGMGLALCILAYSVALFRRRRRAIPLLLIATVVLQVALGISTLLMYVPVPLASLHQAVAFILWALMLCQVYLNGRHHTGALETPREREIVHS